MRPLEGGGRSTDPEVPEFDKRMSDPVQGMPAATEVDGDPFPAPREILAGSIQIDWPGEARSDEEAIQQIIEWCAEENIPVVHHRR